VTFRVEVELGIDAKGGRGLRGEAVVILEIKGGFEDRCLRDTYNLYENAVGFKPLKRRFYYSMKYEAINFPLQGCHLVLYSVGLAKHKHGCSVLDICLIGQGFYDNSMINII
jgi:hypothetical protein